MASVSWQSAKATDESTLLVPYTASCSRYTKSFRYTRTDARLIANHKPNPKFRVFGKLITQLLLSPQFLYTEIYIITAFNF